MANVNHAKVWITSGEASRRLGCSPTTLYRLSDRGVIRFMDLPGVKARRFRVADIERLEAQGSGAAEAEGAGLAVAKN